jgi:hypothetical protein
MRRIMIARRNNVRDHEALKRARRLSSATTTTTKPQQQQQHPPPENQPLPNEQQQQQHQREQQHPQQECIPDEPCNDEVQPPIEGTTVSQEEPVEEGEEKPNQIEGEQPPRKVLKLGDDVANDSGENNDGIDAVVKSLDVDFDVRMGNGGEDEADHQLEETELQLLQQQRRRRPSTLFSDAEVAREMDVPAVEATRSYRTWMALPEGAEFVYNQKYIRGRAGHDWLLRKNIWRRMRYRRENKRMVDQLIKTRSSSSSRGGNIPGGKGGSGVHSPSGDIAKNPSAVSTASQIVDQALLSTPAASVTVHGMVGGIDHPHDDLSDTATTTATAAAAAASMLGDHSGVSSSHTAADSAAVEAAVAVAESYAKRPYNVVHNPLQASTSTATTLALDAAAQLAAAAAADAASSVAHATNLDSEALVLAAAVTEHAMAEATEAAMKSTGDHYGTQLSAPV